ncbi:AmmeMemoRadiSam system protein B [Candidatus Dependentiae bacterium]
MFFKKKQNIVYLGMALALSGCDNATTKHTKMHVSTLSSGWYPKNPSVLKSLINYQINFSKKIFETPVKTTPKAIISPHAGLSYSGIASASAYKNLLSEDGKPNKKIKKVIILAPSHGINFRGIALPNYTKYQIPIGEIPVETSCIDKLSKNKLFNFFQEAHNKEHSLEMQLPWLKTTLSNFSIIPLIVGNMSHSEIEKIADKIKEIIDEQTLVVVTSDFIHYGKNYGYTPFEKDISAKAKSLDSMLIEQILALDEKKFSNTLAQSRATVCGKTPIKILLRLAKIGALGKVSPELNSYYTSAHIRGKTAETLSQKDLFRPLEDAEMVGVVSYAGISFFKSPNSSDKPTPLSGYEQNALLSLARYSVKSSFEKENTKKYTLSAAFPIITPRITENRGAFVTLETKLGRLKGCIGRITTKDPLAKTIVSMSQSAAFNDSRFPPLKREELENINFSINVLTKPAPVGSYKDIVIGKHGIILEKTVNGRFFSSVFLPSVAKDFGWTIEETLQHLSRKSGMSVNAWQNNAKFKVFESQKFQDE